MGAQVRRAVDARPPHRRSGDLPSKGRDAADSEPARRLGHHQIAIPGRHAKDSENRRVPSIHKDVWRGSSSAARRSAQARSCSARPLASTSRTSRQRGNPCCCSRTATTSRARNPVPASIAPSCARSTCPGMTSVTKGLPPPGRRSGHSHDSTDARARRHQADAAVPEHHR
jgi:hypothetical protein